MFCVVFGILQAGSNNVLLTVFLVLGVAFLIGFFLYIRSRERAGKEPLLSTATVQEPHVQSRPRHSEHRSG